MQRRRLGLSALLYFVLVLAPPPAIAECDGPFPSFRNAAPSARQIIIGQVVAAADDRADRTDGRTSNFLLRGWSVLEDSRPIEVQIQEVPTQPCAGVIVARPGDEIAIAFGGRDFQPPQVVNAVAWLSGAAPQLIGIETVTLVEVYALVGTRCTDKPAGPGAACRRGADALASCVAPHRGGGWRHRASGPPEHDLRHDLLDGPFRFRSEAGHHAPSEWCRRDQGSPAGRVRLLVDGKATTAGPVSR